MMSMSMGRILRKTGVRAGFSADAFTFRNTGRPGCLISLRSVGALWAHSAAQKPKIAATTTGT
jgi:hypothetical protein